jgi:hypothetical protein
VPIRSLDRQLGGERLAIGEGAPALLGGLLAVVCRGATVLGGEHAMLGGLRAMFRGALAVLGGTHDDLHTEVRLAAGLLNLGVALGHRQIARGGGLVSRERREITGMRDGVAVCGGV